jgi:acylphosphatase
VRNRYDGAVEALLRGSPSAVEALIAEMRQGPRFASVDNLSVTEHDDPGGDDGGTFVIRSTL